MYVCMCIYMYICVCIYIYIGLQRENFVLISAIFSYIFKLTYT